MKSTESPGESIALLIDADNAPAAKIDFIIAELASYGVVNIRRAYGNWKKQGLKGWDDILHEYAIHPIHQKDLTKGKNATDVALVIDAMDLLYTKSVETFCLVSSDCDFTPLVRRLREDGKKVIGFGGQKTPSPFVDICTRFLFLDDDERVKAVRKDKATSANQLKQDTKLMTVLRNAVDAASDDDGWARLGPIGSHISNQGSFDSRNYGFKKLSDLFAAIDLFEVEKTRKNNVTVYSVRNRRRGRTGD